MSSQSASRNGVRISNGRRKKQRQHKGSAPQRQAPVTAAQCEAAARRIALATGNTLVLTNEEAGRLARGPGCRLYDPANVWRAPSHGQEREASQGRYQARRWS